MAAYYLREVRNIQPHGPYCFAGYSFGGYVIYEMAQQLRTVGETVALLGFLDTIEWQYYEGITHPEDLRQRWALRLNRLMYRRWDYVRDTAFSAATNVFYRLFHKLGWSLPQGMSTLEKINLLAMSQYHPAVYPGRLTIFRSVTRDAALGEDELLGAGAGSFLAASKCWMSRAATWRCSLSPKCARLSGKVARLPRSVAPSGSPGSPRRFAGKLVAAHAHVGLIRDRNDCFLELSKSITKPKNPRYPPANVRNLSDVLDPQRPEHRRISPVDRSQTNSNAQIPRDCRERVIAVGDLRNRTLQNLLDLEIVPRLAPSRKPLCVSSTSGTPRFSQLKATCSMRWLPLPKNTVQQCDEPLLLLECTQRSTPTSELRVTAQTMASSACEMLNFSPSVSCPSIKKGFPCSP